MAALIRVSLGAETGPERARRIRPGDGEYPSRLAHLAVPPQALWARGPLEIPPSRVIGIVGTRRATEYGRRMARDLAFDLAAAGWTIVSGAAIGIDSAAHRGALEAAGKTIAVLGCGIDHDYPARNRELRRAIAETGLLLSEYPPDEPPLKYHFPERNRIIAALSRAVIVVQAGERSGALITAGMALELGREVLAVPGPADQPGSHGVHRLLREGAGLVESATDVVEAIEGPGAFRGRSDRGIQAVLFDPEDRGAGSREADTPRAKLERRLASGSARVDELARAAELSVSDTLSELSRLELEGRVRSLPGLRFEPMGR